VSETGPVQIDQYRMLHARGAYGDRSVKKLRFIQPHLLIRRPKSLIDFGCGQSTLADNLNVPSLERVDRYDPAIPRYATPPAGVYDVLVNIDVLEHVPEPQLEPLLRQMRSLCRDALIVIDTVPATQILPNGENAHCTIHPAEWWKEKLQPIFGELHRIHVARSGRAAFITWRYSLSDRCRLTLLQMRAHGVHFARRIVGLK